ncbi:phosphoribosylformylglycinamidine cyclo-ligase [Hyphobacterium sp. CCMP332]|uniref:phosphoribosylformylglycinamidine cyclo-ligase n=1 Tax=Hyphobacterium sp. CCMP332 TaxID=2749086 RepID=UPI001650CCD1|nr:phosphoribosylformylglycinamidine cyclo-ligase [Hyphobacterium sp. CCMP332]QNL18560.1 phosphoribosylformylglycinamidine cyclo-ligase [Hyphobacterium sp. CCMP332]
MTDKRRNSLTYADAGVDIDAGDALVDRIKPHAKSTARPGAEVALGGFGGAFDLKAAGYEDPILVSGTDGVGTKLRIAIETGRFDTIGIDLVAMCANDVLAQGAEPLFFLDYFATGKLDPVRGEAIVAGIAEGCRQSGCALIGGETAEMPGMYSGDDFDLAGFVVGAAERGSLLPRLDDMQAGDVLIGLASSGPHSNGYSLIRKVVEMSGLTWTDDAPFAPGQSVGEALLTPTKLYIKSVVPLIKEGLVKGLAHITGGGLIENPPRMLPDHLGFELDYSSWQRPAVFDWLAETGGIDESEMRRAFNGGIGMLLAVAADDAEAITVALHDAGEDAFVCGQLVAK